MATIQSSAHLFESIRVPVLKQRNNYPTMAALSIPNPRPRKVSVTNNQTRRLFTDNLDLGFSFSSKIQEDEEDNVSDSLIVEKLHALMEVVADRVEMHRNIGEQRNNWNNQLLTSINAITLAAATMSGISVTGLLLGAPNVLALKLCCTFLYVSATGLLIIMNKIQPSQLVEEQRNATRLFQQLYNHIQTVVEIGRFSDKDVKEAMDKVLAIDKAYPLPLLGGVMLEKFPSLLKPSVWWPEQEQEQEQEQQRRRRPSSPKTSEDLNGWDMKLEEEMRQIVEIIRKKDKADYVRLGGKALKMNRIMAITGPALTAMAAFGSALMGSSSSSSLNQWAAIVGIVGGAMASVVNTLEHGGQVGMVFEMYRNNAAFFDFLNESMEFNLMEKEVNKRENGELLEMKIALQLGRSLSELRNLASSSSSSSSSSLNQNGQIQEFASKLF